MKEYHLSVGSMKLIGTIRRCIANNLYKTTRRIGKVVQFKCPTDSAVILSEGSQVNGLTIYEFVAEEGPIIIVPAILVFPKSTNHLIELVNVINLTHHFSKLDNEAAVQICSIRPFCL